MYLERTIRTLPIIRTHCAKNWMPFIEKSGCCSANTIIYSGNTCKHTIVPDTHDKLSRLVLSPWYVGRSSTYCASPLHCNMADFMGMALPHSPSPAARILEFSSYSCMPRETPLVNSSVALSSLACIPLSPSSLPCNTPWKCRG